MTEPIFDPLFWKERLKNCQGQIHKSVVHIAKSQLDEINLEHKKQLLDSIEELDSVLDVGCGYGRILPLMPTHWTGSYTGIDICPEFIEQCKKDYHNKEFKVMDMRFLQFPAKSFDVGIVSGIKNMVIRNKSLDEWILIESELHRVCKRLVFLTFGEWD